MDGWLPNSVVQKNAYIWNLFMNTCLCIDHYYICYAIWWYPALWKLGHITKKTASLGGCIDRSVSWYFTWTVYQSPTTCAAFNYRTLNPKNFKFDRHQCADDLHRLAGEWVKVILDFVAAWDHKCFTNTSCFSNIHLLYLYSSTYLLSQWLNINSWLMHMFNMFKVNLSLFLLTFSSNYM